VNPYTYMSYNTGIRIRGWIGFYLSCPKQWILGVSGVVKRVGVCITMSRLRNVLKSICHGHSFTTYMNENKVKT